MAKTSMTRSEKIALLIVAVIAVCAMAGAMLRRADAPAQQTTAVQAPVTIDTTKTYRADSVQRIRRKKAVKRPVKSQKLKTKTPPRDMTLTPNEENEQYR